MSGGTESLVVLQVGETLYGTPELIALFTPTRHCSLSRIRSIHYTKPSNSFKIHFNIILPSARACSKWSLRFRLDQQTHVRM